MYDRIIDGQEHTFGVSGKLIRNVLVMYDRETDTLWSQLLGEAVDGPLAGTKLTPIPAVQTTWAEWKKAHPETLALDIGGAAYDSYSSYYTSNQAGVLGETIEDERLPRKELVYGLVVDGQPVAYPFSRLREEQVVNDEVAGKPLLIVFHRVTATALAFWRSLDGETLTFTPAPGDPAAFVDQETGSTWSLLTGGATSGPLAGKQLERAAGVSAFWFGWKDFYSDTQVYGVK